MTKRLPPVTKTGPQVQQVKKATVQTSRPKSSGLQYTSPAAFRSNPTRPDAKTGSIGKGVVAGTKQKSARGPALSLPDGAAAGDGHIDHQPSSASSVKAKPVGSTMVSVTRSSKKEDPSRSPVTNPNVSTMPPAYETVAKPASSSRRENKGSPDQQEAIGRNGYWKRSKLSKTTTVLTMLKDTNGATLAAIMTATGWQAHSVRGFLAGVVRRKLGLVLLSEQTDGGRRYRIKAEPEPSSTPKPTVTAT